MKNYDKLGKELKEAVNTYTSACIAQGIHGLTQKDLKKLKSKLRSKLSKEDQAAFDAYLDE